MLFRLTGVKFNRLSAIGSSVDESDEAPRSSDADWQKRPSSLARDYGALAVSIMFVGWSEEASNCGASFHSCIYSQWEMQVHVTLWS